MDVEFKYEIESGDFFYLRSPAKAYDAADETEKARIRKLVQNMNLFDDDLMSRVFDQNIPAAEYLLKTILQRDDLHVLSVFGQHELKNGNPEGRNIKLDIHAVLDNGEEFDVEVQRRDDGADYHRARFNSSMLDVRMLKAKEEFDTLKDSYVIFITEHDVPGKGCPLYHVERIIRETGEMFDDGSHIIYVNGEYKGSDEIGRMIHDFHCTKADDIYNPELAKSVRHFKDEEGVKNMCASVKAYGDIRAAEAAALADANGFARGDASGFARGDAHGRAEAAKEYQEEIERLKAELAKFTAAEKSN